MRSVIATTVNSYTLGVLNDPLVSVSGAWDACRCRRRLLQAP